ncbi:MAG: DUF1080 domain-containing protein, partial [bacterium]
CVFMIVAILFGCQAEEKLEPFVVDIPDHSTLAADSLGWISLFNGKTFDGWRGFRKHDMPAGWEITSAGELYFNGKGKGDIVTTHQFGNFELELEWKISPGGNSGIFYWVTEDDFASWRTGPEMQVLDNTAHKDGKKALTSAGSNYALHAPASDVTKPVGEYNHARIIANGTHVEHWLNGEKIVEYEIGSSEWQALVDASKFGKMPNYGKNRNGHIALQDHGDEVWYRNIRVRLLNENPGETGGL